MCHSMYIFLELARHTPFCTVNVKAVYGSASQRLFTPTTIRPCPIRPRFSKNGPYSPLVLFTPVWVYIVDEYNCVSINAFYVL